MVSLCRSGSHKHKLDADRLFSIVQVYSDIGISELRFLLDTQSLYRSYTKRVFCIASTYLVHK